MRPTHGRSLLTRAAGLSVAAAALTTAFVAVPGSAEAEPPASQPPVVTGTQQSPAPSAGPAASANPAPPANAQTSASPAAPAPRTEPKNPAPADDKRPEGDTKIKVSGPTQIKAGKPAVLTFTVAATVPNRHYVMVTLPKGLAAGKLAANHGWDISVQKNPQEILAVYNGKPDASIPAPPPVEIPVVALDGKARSATVRATVPSLLIKDTDPSNNVVETTLQVEGAATIKGFAWHDVNRDGQLHGEPPMAEAFAVLLRVEKDKTVVAGQTALVKGHYRFEHAPAGKYVVAILATGKWAITTPNVGNDRTDSDILADPPAGLPELVDEPDDSAAEGKAKDLAEGLAADADKADADKADKNDADDADNADDADEDIVGGFSAMLDVTGAADVAIDGGFVSPGTGTGSSIGDPLPTTGTALAGYVGAGLALLAGGLGLLMVTRRRRKAAIAG